VQAFFADGKAAGIRINIKTKIMTSGQKGTGTQLMIGLTKEIQIKRFKEIQLQVLHVLLNVSVLMILLAILNIT